MYNFIDVNEASESVVLPSEALRINGEYIENLIDGYRTLNVSGREALSPEVETYTTGIRNGSKLKSKRYPERIITVRYQITAKTNEEYRAAYNELARILNVKEAELIFNDERDKFFIGTPCIIGAVEPGRNSVVGEFEILCADPFKYSVIEYEAEPNLDNSSIIIHYNGTHEAFPTLQATFHKENESDAALTGNGDCGFVAFFNEDAKIIQLGDPDEADTESYAKSQTLVSQMFDKETAWGTIAQTNWLTNTGKVLSSSFQQSGSVNMAVSGYLTPVSIATSGTLLTKNSTEAKPNIKYTVTAKASGREEDRINVKVSISAFVEGVASVGYYSGGTQAGSLVSVGTSWANIYKSSYDTTPSGKASPGATFYLWDTSVRNGKIRVTNQKKNVGVSGQVSGWIDASEVYIQPVSVAYTTRTGLGSGYGLKASIKLGSDSWEEVVLKNESATWGADSTYTKTLDITVKDIDADTTVIEDIQFKVERTDSKGGRIGIIDETDCADLEISTYTAPIPNEWYLAPETFGTGASYHGPTITRKIPADAAGDVGAANFSFSFKHKFGCGTSSIETQGIGSQSAWIVSGSGSTRSILVGFEMRKPSTNSTNGTLNYYVNGKKVDSFSIDLSNQNTVVKSAAISKMNESVTIDVYGIKRTYKDASIKTKVATEITFHFAQYSTYPALHYNGIYEAKFVKNNCDTWNDIPNKFSSNDVVIADCKNGEIFLNGILTPALGALGNDWEEFHLTPGLNQIGFSYSDWVAAGCEPTFRVRYREVFL